MFFYVRAARLLLAAAALMLLLAACNRPGIPPAEAPELIAPAAGASVDTAFPTFAWEEVSNAKAYTIEVEPLDGGAPIVEVTERQEHSLERGLRIGVEYRWTVRGSNEGGFGPPAAPRLLEVSSAARPGPPFLDGSAENAASDGDLITSSELKLLWHPRGDEIKSRIESCVLEPGCPDGSGWTVGGDFYELEVRVGSDLVFDRLVPTFRVNRRFGGFDLSFEDPGHVDPSRGEIPLTCDSDYSWRVRHHRIPDDKTVAIEIKQRAIQAVIDLSGALSSGWSEAWAFHTPGRLDAAPELRFPEDGTVMRGGSLRWGPVDAVEGRVVYQLEITDRPRTSGAPSWHHEPRSQDLGLSYGHGGIRLRAGETYYWRVRAAQSGERCAGPWSPVWSFTWQPPTPTPREGSEELSEGTSLEPPSPVCEDPPCPTATMTPFPTWTPTTPPYLEGVSFLVVESPSTCRSGPGTVYSPLFYFDEGDELVVQGTDPSESWWNVHAPDSEELCWISDQLVRPGRLGDEIPIFTPAPTPTWTLPPPTEEPASGPEGCLYYDENQAEVCYPIDECPVDFEDSLGACTP